MKIKSKCCHAELEGEEMDLSENQDGSEMELVALKCSKCKELLLPDQIYDELEPDKDTKLPCGCIISKSLFCTVHYKGENCNINH